MSISLVAMILFFGIFFQYLFFLMGPLGSWQGELESGMAKFRIALVLQRNPDGKPLAAYNNIDDGIYNQPFKTFVLKGKIFRGELATGEVLDLSVSGFGFGNELRGTYTQSHGSFQRDGKISQMILRRGEDYLSPRLDSGRHSVTEYQYRVPLKSPDGWEVDRITDEVVLGKLNAGISQVLSGDLPHIHSLTVAKGGRLVLDEYFYGYGPDELHPVQSITKSVFSLLFGIARDKGWLETDQKLYRFFPGYRSRQDWDARKDQMTLEMLLTMRSGFRCDDWKNSAACSWDMVNSPDWLDFVLSMPLESRPGLQFSYCGACLTPLSVLLARRSGMGLPALAGKFLFEPLGIKDWDWMEGPDKITPAAFGLSLKPRDLAKLGQMILNKGKWNGVQVVSEDWIKRSTSVQVRRNHKKSEADYGYLWWERSLVQGSRKVRVIDGWGVGGQHLFVVPERGLVCVIMTGNYKDSQLGGNSLRFFQDYILGL